MRNEQLSVEVTVPIWRGLEKPSFALPAFSRLMSVVPYRYIRDRATRAAEDLFLARLGRGEVAYLWSEVSLATAHELKRRGIPVVREKTNCHKATAYRLLEHEYSRVGVCPAHNLTPARIAKEREELDLADYVFAPSPMVEQSLTENGISTNKIIDTSYGWDPRRLQGNDRLLPSAPGLTVLFVGSVSIRKGAHLLLEAWAKARIKGRLVLSGRIEAGLATKFSDLLDYPTVLRLGFVGVIGPLYRSADVFVFPSLEEGGPLVTYEALASGLPAVVSPMGAGRAVRDGQEGFVIEPHDVDAWVDTLRTLAASEELRRTMADAARARAKCFTWDLVAASRRESLLARFCGHAPTLGGECVE